MTVEFEINKTYTFNTRAPVILGATFRRVKILGIIDYVLASSFINPETQHHNVYPHLPAGTPSDPKKYTYLLIQTEQGDKTVLAKEWIDPSSVTLVTSTTINITVTGASASDAENIREALLLLGFTNPVITVS